MDYQPIDPQELDRIVYRHERWLNKYSDGEKAVIEGRRLTDRTTRLIDRDLSWAEIHNCDLTGLYMGKSTTKPAVSSAKKTRPGKMADAQIIDCCLDDVDFERVDMMRCVIKNASMLRDKFNHSDLRNCHFEATNLQEAEFFNSDLMGVNFNESNTNNLSMEQVVISPEKLNTIYDQNQAVPDEGAFIGWKNASGYIVKLEIPADAQRVGGLASRKCRASYAYVVSITNMENDQSIASAKSNKDKNTVYEPGKFIYPNQFDTRLDHECTTGIHFYTTREEAVRS